MDKEPCREKGLIDLQTYYSGALDSFLSVLIRRKGKMIFTTQAAQLRDLVNKVPARALSNNNNVIAFHALTLKAGSPTFLWRFQALHVNTYRLPDGKLFC